MIILLEKFFVNAALLKGFFYVDSWYQTLCERFNEKKEAWRRNVSHIKGKFQIFRNIIGTMFLVALTLDLFFK